MEHKTCPRCGRDINSYEQRPVFLRDALSPPIVVHEDCSYDMEWANGAAEYITNPCDIPSLLAADETRRATIAHELDAL